MLSPIKAVALRTIKYDDRHSIVTVWSAEHGRLALLVPASGSREACRMRAIMMPLGLFEGVVDMRPGRDLFNIRDVRPMVVLSSLSVSPAKAVVAMFLAEVLEKVLRDTPPDSVLAEFVFDAVVVLDSMSPRGVANFPIVFLCRLAGMLGVEPDIGGWEKGRMLDMTDGVYRSSASLTGRSLNSEESQIAALVQRMSFSSAQRIPFTRRLRREIIDTILEYYSMHLTPVDSLRSLSVVKDLL